MKRLVIVDGKSVFYRGFYAMRNLTLPDGTPTGGVYGVTMMLLEVLKSLQPDYWVVAWDKSHTNIRRRRELYPEYKANRQKAPEEFYAQIPILLEMLAALNVPLYEMDDFEADDIMGSLARKAEKAGVHVDLVSSDLDMLQIVDKNICFYALKTGLSKMEKFDVEHFEEKYGLRREQFVDWKALKGDPSDNIPGVAGVGDKTAVGLLQKYGTLDEVFEHAAEQKGKLAEKLAAGKEMAYLSRQLAELQFDAPIEFDEKTMKVNLDANKIIPELERLRFQSLLEPFFKLASKQAGGAVSAAGPAMPDAGRPTGQVSSAAGELNADAATVPPGEPYDGRKIADGLVVAEDVKELLGELQHGAKVDFYDTTVAGFLLRNSGVTLPEGGLEQVFNAQREAFNDLPKVKWVAANLDFPLIPVLFKMEQKGLKIDPEQFLELHKKLGQRTEELAEQIQEQAGEKFNIDSPKQLAEVLYGKLKLVTSGLRKTTFGKTTNKAALDKLRTAHPIIPLLEEYRMTKKLMTTYIDTLPGMADKNWRVHTTFSQVATSTGRLASSNPNLQNIPVRTELGRLVREAFVPEKGYVYVAADYAQFELRLAAALAKDEPLIEDFNRGLDVHTKTASDVYGVPMDQVTKEQRNVAKVVNFGVLYGMGAMSLAKTLSISHAAAQEFINKYFELRAPIRKYLDRTLANAKENGYVETYFGRRRSASDLERGNQVMRAATERAILNMPIQGTEADLMKRAMINLDGKLVGLDAALVLQIHDSLMVECKAELADKVALLLREEMEGVMPELKVKLAVDVKVGKNWGEV